MSEEENKAKSKEVLNSEKDQNKPLDSSDESTSEENEIQNKSEEAETPTPEAASDDLNDNSDVLENESQPKETSEEKSSESSTEEKLDTETTTPLTDESEDEDEVTSSDEDEDDENDDENDDAADKKSIDYHSMTQTQLVAALKNVLTTGKIQDIKKDVEAIRVEFNNQFDEELNEKKEEFLAQGGNIIDFHYSTPLKNEFNSLHFEYREKRNNYYKNLKKDLQANLQKRLALIEELKGLISVEENINTTYKHFKDIQERWREAGPIPRDGYNTVWNNYHHHVENFYDFLHLNREFRDLDFKHNLEQKLKIINRAEELADETNINKAFRELQMLHKMWKEDIGPVAKEYRDEVWDRFSAATKVLHDKRAEHQKEIEKDFEKNLEIKTEITNQINLLTQNTKDSHQAWQNGIKTLEDLRDQFFKAGKVPSQHNEETWTAFKTAVRNFNKKKNLFYKNQKKEQFSNLAKKQELIKIAEENKDSEDFDVVTPLMKKIQNDWKQIGHVPRKDSDKIWKKFKAACNHYFDRLHADRNKENEEEVKALELKNALLEQLKSFELTEKPKEDLKFVKEKIANWKEIGRVPFNKKNIESKFNKVIDGLFKKLDMSKKEIELLKYDNKLNNITSHDDERKIQNERFFITKKIDEVKQEINQLENNLGFFQHVDDKNPLVKEVHKNIQRHKDELELWKEKLKKLKEVM
ncbi:MAG: DUF349 domain-containing protein [Flavobacteriaceae bacterium]|nr:DUF349 domain-containing protein [Flavobacteriaceae bacterium]